MKYRNALHYIAGILSCLSYILSPVLPIVGLLGFLAYEVDEDWHIRDQAFHDILEWLIGFYVAIGGLLINTIWR